MFGGLEVWRFGRAGRRPGQKRETWRVRTIMAEFKHKRLKVWQDARRLVKSVYGITQSFPQSEQFGLTSQLRRAAVSVPSNIAEGSCRETPQEFARFLVIARGSAAEVDTQLTLAEDVGYVSSDDALHEEIEKLAKQINSLIVHLKAAKVSPTL